MKKLMSSVIIVLLVSFLALPTQRGNYVRADLKAQAELEKQRANREARGELREARERERLKNEQRAVEIREAKERENLKAEQQSVERKSRQILKSAAEVTDPNDINAILLFKIADLDTRVNVLEEKIRNLEERLRGRDRQRDY